MRQFELDFYLPTAYNGQGGGTVEENERDLLEVMDDNGKQLTLEICRYFYYNGEEYALMRSTDDDDSASYIMHVKSFTDENGEDMEEFEMPDEALLETLLSVVESQMTED